MSTIKRKQGEAATKLEPRGTEEVFAQAQKELLNFVGIARDRWPHRTSAVVY